MLASEPITTFLHPASNTELDALVGRGGGGDELDSLFAQKHGMKRRQVGERDFLDELDRRLLIGVLLEPGGATRVQLFSDSVAFLQFS